MSETRPREPPRRDRRLPGRGARARRGGGAGAPPGRLPRLPRRSALAAAGGAAAARVGRAGRAAAGAARADPRPGERRESGRRGARAGARKRTRRPLFSGRRPLAGCAALALVAAAIAGYAIGGGSGSGGGDDDDGRRQAARGHGEDDPRRRLRDAAPRQRPPAARATGSSRPGCGATAASSPVRSLFVPDREGRASTTIPDLQRRRRRDGHRGAQGRQREPRPRRRWSP